MVLKSSFGIIVVKARNWYKMVINGSKFALFGKIKRIKMERKG